MRKRNALRLEEALVETLTGAHIQFTRCLLRATKTGAWLTVQLSTFNGTELGAQEWRDALFMSYGLELPDLPKLYDGCNAAFSICHALNCKKCVLFLVCHNKIREGFADLSGKAFTPTLAHDDPLIFAGQSVHRTKS